jgi:hypothetical protein
VILPSKESEVVILASKESEMVILPSSTSKESEMAFERESRRGPGISAPLGQGSTDQI